MEQQEIKKLSPLGTVIFVTSLLAGVIAVCFLMESKSLQQQDSGVDRIIIASQETPNPPNLYEMHLL